MKKNKKVFLAAAAFVLVLAVAAASLYRWGDGKLSRARMIQAAIANPEDIDPGVFLGSIDARFMAMAEADKNAILGNPEKLESYVAEATASELRSSFGLLFQMPEPVRRRVIADSAANLRQQVGERQGDVDSFFDSDVGRGALRGASNFFMTELTGKQKIEAMELTHEMYEIVKKQKERR